MTGNLLTNPNVSKASSKLRKSRVGRKTGGADRRSSQTVTTTFAGNEYHGIVKTSSLGQRYFEGQDCRYTWTSGVKYEGPFVSSRAEGQGKLSWPDGSTYSGEVVNGLRNGHGEYTASDGVTKYVGQWRDGKRHGRGRLTYDPEGEAHYDGAWEDGQKHGFGCQVWPSGNRFEGQWKCGKMSGRGTMVWVDGGVVEKFVGYWEDGHPHGEGTQTWCAPEGSGALSSRAGVLPAQQMLNRYEGQWSNGLRNGKGLFCYANGARYAGEWADNVKQGTGRYTHEDGRVYAGPFAGDQMVNGGVPQSAQPSKGALNIGAEDNPVRRCIDVSDLAPFCLPADVGELDLSVGSGYDEADEVLREVYNLLLRRLGLLKALYHDYRMVQQKTGDDPFVLQARQMWALVCDMGLVAPGCSLSVLNRAVFCGPRHHLEAAFDDMEDVKPLEPDFEGEPLTPRAPSVEPADADGEGDAEGGDAEDESAYDDGEGSESQSQASMKSSRLSRASSYNRRSVLRDDSSGSSSVWSEQEHSPKTAPSGGLAPAESQRLEALGSIAEEPGDTASSTSGTRTSKPTPRASAHEDGANALDKLEEKSEGTSQASKDRPPADPFSKFWRREGQEGAVDIHSPETVMLFRHFLEALVRMSIVRFPLEKGLERQMRRLFDEHVLQLASGDAGGSATAGALSFLADEDVQDVLRAFEPELRALFREHAAGEGAYATPQWAPAAPEAAAENPPRRHRRHFGGQNRRSHVRARQDVTVRIKDVLQILSCGGILQPAGSSDAAGAGGAPERWLGPVFQPRGDEALDSDVHPGDSASGAATPVPQSPSPPVRPSSSPGDDTLTADEDGPESAGDAEDAAGEPPCAQAADVLRCDFTATPLQVLRILCELSPPEGLAKVHWSLERGATTEGGEMPLLEFLESEITFVEFSRLLLRLAESKTSEAEFNGDMPLRTRLEGFLAHVFLPSLGTPYVPPPTESPTTDVQPEEEKQPQPASMVEATGAGLPDVNGTYRRAEQIERRPDGGITVYYQETGQFCMVIYPSAVKDGPMWTIQRADNGKRAYVARLGEDPADLDAASAPTSGWEVFDAKGDKASLPGRAPAPAVEPLPEPDADADAEEPEVFWAGFADDSAMEFATYSVPRAWPKDYEDEVAAW